MLTEDNIFVQIPSYIFWKDTHFSYLGGNNALAAGFNSEKEIIGKSDYDCIWKQYADMYRDGDAAALDGVEFKNRIEPQIQADGITKIIMVNKSRLYDRNHQIRGIVGSYTEIIDERLTGRFDPLKNNISLTQKEADCLLMLVKGYTNKEIADVFKLSTRTVTHRIDNIKTKLKCYSKPQLIKKAFNLEFIRMRLILTLCGKG